MDYIQVGLQSMKNRKGFSLLEVIVVIAIMGTLTLTAFNYSTSLNAGIRAKTTMQNAQIIAEQVRRYYDINAKVPDNQDTFEQLLNNQDYFPTIPENLVDTTTTTQTSTKWVWTRISTFAGTVKPNGIVGDPNQFTVTVDLTAVTRENINFNLQGRSWGGDG